MKNKITQAFILGAGLGTRLRPLTDTVPKVMVPIAPGKPLLEHTIELLRDQGICDLVINLYYLPKIIVSYFGNGERFGVNIVYSDESDKLLETGGAIRKAADLLDDDFLFIFGDELHFFDFAPLIRFHLEHSALITMVLKDSDIPQNGDLAEFDPITKKVTRWHARPHGIAKMSDHCLLNAGLYALSKRIVDYIPPGRPVKLDGEVVPAAFAAGEKFYAFPTKEPILDIGTPEKYEFAKRYYMEKTKK